MKQKITIIILILLTSNIFGQNDSHPSQRSQTELDKRIYLAKKTDSLIEISYEMAFKEKIITTGLSEGSMKLVDSLKNEIGSGGFTTYTYTNQKINKIVKAKFNKTIHYNYDTKDSINANTERIEISIYFKEESPYLAEFIENHYDSKNVIFANRYYVFLNNTEKEIYFSNSFQKGIVNYIMKLSAKIIDESKK